MGDGNAPALGFLADQHLIDHSIEGFLSECLRFELELNLIKVLLEEGLSLLVAAKQLHILQDVQVLLNELAALESHPGLEIASGDLIVTHRSDRLAGLKDRGF